ncbi:MAG: hypothetical protein C4527_28720 [Candidatus Omnitrophota bacterium]|jgi:oligogalacturonide lyase|nr:MAG: hypothetical protein C4527_28720 [Candidatus Omnitrophota bacterium]
MVGWKIGIVFVSMIIAVSAFTNSSISWQCPVQSAEWEKTVDPETGANVIFITTHPADDNNLYFHDRSWLEDESMVIFTSNRNGKTEPFGFIEKTGEIVRLNPPDFPSTAGFTAGKRNSCLYLTKADGVYEWQIGRKPVTEAVRQESRVRINERMISRFPENVYPCGSLNENADATRLSLILRRRDSDLSDIVLIDKQTGAFENVASVNWPVTHLQCSWTQPDLVMFAREYPPHGDRVPIMSDEEYAKQEPHARFWFADLSHREPWTIHYQQPGELVTHECWWLRNQITFCGGFLPEESHVKVIDMQTGVTRIAGAGCWLPNISSADLAKRNWWHAAGSPKGDWIAADNWHGDIVLFNARTTEMRLLTSGHRTYGKGAHPHVGWAPAGDRVVFTSNKRGHADVCIAYLQ